MTTPAAGPTPPPAPRSPSAVTTSLALLLVAGLTALVLALGFYSLFSFMLGAACMGAGPEDEPLLCTPTGEALLWGAIGVLWLALAASWVVAVRKTVLGLRRGEPGALAWPFAGAGLATLAFLVFLAFTSALVP